MKIRQRLLYFEMLVYIIEAWLLLTSNQLKKVKNYQKSDIHDLSPKDLERIVEFVDSKSEFYLKGNPNRCFYRAFILYNILSKMGLDLKINIGMSNMDDQREAKGHCWLSQEGKDLFEDEEPEKYPVYLGVREKIRYWMNDSSYMQGKHLQKKKNQKRNQEN
ncbi:MAG: lasso peptide biosynthesis protein [Candidatus Stygibacter australis]|nr:lasso peptide biosynthesis protein [Candidatus Stygibacter australis]